MDKHESLRFKQNSQEMTWYIQGDTLISFANALNKEKFTSSIFTMCGAIWQLECYPNGNKLINEKHICIYVRCVSLPSHIKRLGVIYRLRFITGTGSAIPISKASSCSKWYESGKSFGFSRIAPTSVFNEFKKIKIKLHICDSLTMENGWILWKLDNYFVNVMKTVSKPDKSKIHRLGKSFRSPEFEMIGGVWYLEIFPKSTKIILRGSNSVKDKTEIHLFYRLKSKELGVYTVSEDKTNAIIISKQTAITNKWDMYQWNSANEITISCYLWTNRKSFKMNIKKKFNDIKVKTINFTLHGFEWQLIYKSKEERTNLLVIGYCRQLFDAIPVDITNIISSHVEESETGMDRFMMEGSMDLRLFNYPPRICGVTISRQIECEQLSLSENDMIVFNMNNDYCDTSSKFWITDNELEKIMRYIDVLCVIDIISIQTKPDEISYKLKALIRDDAIYTPPKINELHKKSYMKILDQHRIIVDCWIDNTNKLNNLLSKYDENEIKERFALRLYDESMKYQELLNIHSHQAKSVESDIAAIILYQNEIFMLLTENKTQTELTEMEWTSFMEEYKSVKRKRESFEPELKQNVDEIDKLMKSNFYSDNVERLSIKQKVNECNDMIVSENKLYIEICKKKNLKQLLDGRQKEINDLLKEYETIINEYQNEIQKNADMTYKINTFFDDKWNLFESTWIKWTFKDIIIWFQYKTRKYKENIISWTQTESIFEKENICGNSLQNMNASVIVGIGIYDVDIAVYLVEQIKILLSKYKIENDEYKNIECPNKFICQITKQIMIDPVIAFDGYSYERVAIEEYLKTHKKSPITNEMVTVLNVFPNIQLKKEIEAYLTLMP